MIGDGDEVIVRGERTEAGDTPAIKLDDEAAIQLADVETEVVASRWCRQALVRASMGVVLLAAAGAIAVSTAVV